MYHLLGGDGGLPAIEALARPYMLDPNASSAEDLSRAFLACLSHQQPHVPKNWSSDPVIDDEDIEAALAQVYLAHSPSGSSPRRTGLIVPRGPAKVRMLGQIRASVEALQALDQGLATIFRLAIHSIFIRRPGGPSMAGDGLCGSSEHAIGAIWISRDRLSLYSPINLIELLIRELTHHLLYIETLLEHGRPFLAQARWLEAAAPPEDRAAENAIHRIVSATEVVLARLRYGLPVQEQGLLPPTDLLMDQILASLQDARAMPGLHETRVPGSIALLDACEDKLIDARQLRRLQSQRSAS